MTTIAADLFAGLGGWSAGAALAGVRVVFAANHWPAAVAVHRINHPGVHHECQDLMQIDWRALPDLRDGVLIASPACQGFSPNGRPGRVRPRAAVKHQQDRNTTWAVLAAADTARPAIILVENVPELAAWDLFPAWCDTLRAMGYRVAHQVVNAQDYGVPQDRRRLIVQALRHREPIAIVPTTARVGVGSAIDQAAGGWHQVASKTPGMAARMREAARRAPGPCLWANVDSARGRRLDEPAPTMTTRSAGQWYLIDGPRCRMLNVRELARIQGFPDSYMLPAARTLAGRLLGNSVPVPMARAIVEQVVGVEAAVA